MIDPRILEKFGSTNDRIRQVFTAKEGTDDWKHRCRFEKNISGRLHSGVQTNLRNYRLFAASDLAWDSSPITGEVVPLLQYAQGKIKFERLQRELKNLPEDVQEKICERDPKTKEIKSVKLSKFHEVWVNLVRSFITRRQAALAAKYVKLFPFYKYEPYSTSYVAKLRGDVLSQRIEMIVNQYGLRHELVQTIRDVLLYAHSVEFPACSWDKEEQIFFRPGAEGFEDDSNTESRIVREGVPFIRPHPSRVFYDNAYPLSSINTDTGCQWIGFWDVVRWGEIDGNPKYWNRDCVGYTQRWYALYNECPSYFEQYFDCRIQFPNPGGEDISGLNDRKNNVGLYCGEKVDEHALLAEYREKVIPKDVGLGDYPHPVWIRLVVAGDKTVIFGEFLPSHPAIYYGYNENDSRQNNISFAHEIMPWQDQVSNLLTQLLITQKTGLIKLIELNIDAIDDPKIIEEFRSLVNSEQLYAGPALLEVSKAKMRELGMDRDSVIQMHEAKSLEDITTFFRSVIQLFSLAERVLNFSPQEQGQAASHEISATETAMINNTTETMYEYHALGIDEGNAAKKKVLYESYMAHGSSEIRVPVLGRYTREIIEKAGFSYIDEDSDEADSETAGEPLTGPTRHHTITGNKGLLLYDWNYSSRDGGERASNARAAEVAMQLVAQIAPLQIGGRSLIEDMGKEQFYKLITEIFRLADPGLNVRFDESAGEQPALPMDPNAPDPAMLAQQVVEIAQRLDLQQETLNAITEAILPQAPTAEGESIPGVPGIPVPPDPFVPAPVEPMLPPAFADNEIL